MGSRDKNFSWQLTHPHAIKNRKNYHHHSPPLKEESTPNPPQIRTPRKILLSREAGVFRVLLSEATNTQGSRLWSSSNFGNRSRFDNFGLLLGQVERVKASENQHRVLVTIWGFLFAKALHQLSPSAFPFSATMI